MPPKTEIKRKAYRIVDDFLIPALDQNTYGRLLEWEGESKFRIAWMHKARTSWKKSELKLFLHWDALKNRYPPQEPPGLQIGRPPRGCKYHKFLVNSKQRLRSALRVCKSVNELPCTSDYKRYVIHQLDELRQNHQTGHKLEKKKLALQSCHDGDYNDQPPPSPPATSTAASGSRSRNRRKTKVKQEMYTGPDDEEDKDDPTYYPQTTRTRSGRRVCMRIKKQAYKHCEEELSSHLNAVSLNCTEENGISTTNLESQQILANGFSTLNLEGQQIIANGVSTPNLETQHIPKTGFFTLPTEETQKTGIPKKRISRELSSILEDQAHFQYKTVAEPKRKSNVSQNSWANSLEEKQALNGQLFKVKEEPVWSPIPIPINPAPTELSLSELELTPFQAASMPKKNAPKTQSLDLGSFGLGRTTEQEPQVTETNSPTDLMNLRPRPSVVRLSSFDYGTSQESEDEEDRFRVSAAKLVQKSATITSDTYNVSKKRNPQRRKSKKEQSTDFYYPSIVPKKEPKDFEPYTGSVLSSFSQLPFYETEKGVKNDELPTFGTNTDQGIDKKRKSKRSQRKRTESVVKQEPLDFTNFSLWDTIESQPQAEQYGARPEQTIASATAVDWKPKDSDPLWSSTSWFYNQGIGKQEDDDYKFSVLIKPDCIFAQYINKYTKELLNGCTAPTLLEKAEKMQYELDQPYTYPNIDQYYK